AYGVRGACSRFRTAPHIRQREQTPRTPYASRDTAAPRRSARAIGPVFPGKSARKNDIFGYILQRAAMVPRRAEDPARRDALPSAPYRWSCCRAASVANRGESIWFSFGSICQHDLALSAAENQLATGFLIVLVL